MGTPRGPRETGNGSGPLPRTVWGTTWNCPEALGHLKCSFVPFGTRLATQCFATAVMLLARAANSKDIKVSSELEQAGQDLTDIKVLAVPYKGSCINCVSLWFLYCTCFSLFVKASVTSPRAVRDLLISRSSKLT